MKNLKGTKTEANLLAAFAGESMARNRYTFYSSKAKKDGFEQIAGIFNETAANEKEHAEIWFKLLHDGIGDTSANLLDAAEGEHAEWTHMYKTFSEEAEAEGFTDIARLFAAVGDIERTHEQRFRALLSNIEAGKVFQRPDKVRWICRNCGHIHNGTEAPKVCPVCGHERSFFEIKCENF